MTTASKDDYPLERSFLGASRCTISNAQCTDYSVVSACISRIGYGKNCLAIFCIQVYQGQMI
ncbi:hypothetical protein CJF30_00002520 [Rutstroemia sp. NJR-2017a BBW]|nr:hypothetical protein CJF30_00002520 [Rutstroemia sp. NJR-2017a BBW]